MELGRPDARRVEKVSWPLPEKIALPHDMVIFPDGAFGEHHGWLKPLETAGFELSDFPKMQVPVPQKRAEFIFGDCFWEKNRMFPQGEVLQV